LPVNLKRRYNGSTVLLLQSKKRNRNDLLSFAYLQTEAHVGVSANVGSVAFCFVCVDATRAVGFGKCSFFTFCLDTKSNKKVKAAIIAPRMRPGQRTGQESL
jgi:hypothetical protein